MSILPELIGGVSLIRFREVLRDRTWVGEGPNGVVQLTALSSLEARDPEILAGLERRLADVERLLARKSHPGILRPTGVGVETLLRDGGRTRSFVWIAAESPGVGAKSWSPTYRGLDSLAEALTFLHDRKFVHSGVIRENLWLRSDGSVALAPWSAEDVRAQRPTLSRIVRGAFSATVDVAALADLLPKNDPEYVAIAERCRATDETRPANGLGVLFLLRETSDGKRYLKENDLAPLDREEGLRDLAELWLDAPNFVETERYREFVVSLERTGAARVRGASGSGKSRWLSEVGERLSASGDVVAHGRGNAPGGPIVDACRDLVSQEIVGSGLVDRALGAASADELVDCLMRAGAEIGEQRRLVWLLDDVDKADARNEKAIETALKWVVKAGSDEETETNRFVLAVTETTETDSEAEVTSVAGGSGDATVITIPPQGAAEVKQLVATLLGMGSEASYFGEVLAAETEGNPFHVIELLRHLVRDKVIAPRAARLAIDWQRLGLERPSEDRVRAELEKATFALPKGVAAVLEGRFADLGDDERRVLRVLALAEGEVDLDLLGELLDVDADDLFELVEPLALTERLIEIDGEKMPEPVRFRTARLKKFFAAGWSVDERRRQHTAYLRALEERWSDLDVPGPMMPWTASLKPAEQRVAEGRVAILAAHATAANDRDRMRYYLPIAAASAQRVSEFREARRLYANAREVFIGESHERRLCEVGMGEVLRITGATDEAERLFVDVLDRSREEHDRVAEGHAFLGMAGVHFSRGQWRDMLKAAARAFRISQDIADVHLEARSRDAVAYGCRGLGSLGAVEYWATRAIELYEKEGQTNRVAGLNQLLGNVLLDFGAYQRAGEHHERLESVVRRSGDRRQLAWNGLARARLALDQGRMPVAVERCRNALGNARVVGDDGLLFSCHLATSFALMSQMEFRAADVQIEHARALRLPDAPRFVVAMAWHEGWNALLQKKDASAARFASIALGADNPRLAPLWRGLVHSALSYAEYHAGRFDEASRWIDVAQGHAQRSRNGLLVHNCSVLAAACATRAGRSVAEDGRMRRAVLEALRFAERGNLPELAFKAKCVLYAIGDERDGEGAGHAGKFGATGEEIPYGRRDIVLFNSLYREVALQ